MSRQLYEAYICVPPHFLFSSLKIHPNCREQLEEHPVFTTGEGGGGAGVLSSGSLGGLSVCVGGGGSGEGSQQSNCIILKFAQLLEIR